MFVFGVPRKPHFVAKSARIALFGSEAVVYTKLKGNWNVLFACESNVMSLCFPPPMSVLLIG